MATVIDSSDNNVARIMMNLIEIAARDGLITAEEQEILDSIDNSLYFYKNALAEANADGTITVEEQVHLEKIRDIIINSARIIAQQSNNDIDDDELTLLLAAMCQIHVPQAV